MTIATAYLETDHLIKRFDGVAAVSDVSLSINKGEIFALLGSSGCGKSTLLRMLAGFEVPTSGRILLGGQDIAAMQPHERTVNMMFLSYALFPHLSVWDNIAFGLKREGMPKAQIAQRVAERDFLRPIKWLETDSRDTRENARLAVKKLSDAHIRHIVLVTHAWHMPRALRAFREAAGDSMRITAAPMGYFVPAEHALLDWLPSSEGFEQVRLVLREALGMQMGA